MLRLIFAEIAFFIPSFSLIVVIIFFIWSLSSILVFVYLIYKNTGFFCWFTYYDSWSEFFLFVNVKGSTSDSLESLLLEKSEISDLDSSILFCYFKSVDYSAFIYWFRFIDWLGVTIVTGWDFMSANFDLVKGFRSN